MKMFLGLPSIVTSSEVSSNSRHYCTPAACRPRAWALPTSPLPLYACALTLIVFAKMALSKTFGQKPIKFQLEQDGDFYMIGSEVRFLFLRALCVCLHTICINVAIILTLKHLWLVFVGCCQLKMLISAYRRNEWMIKWS